MLTNKTDAQIEKLMNEEGLSHSEALDELKKRKKTPAKTAPAEGSAEEEASESADVEKAEETMTLPADLLPNVSVGKEVDLSIHGTVSSKSDGTIQIKTTSVNVGMREPYKPEGNTKGSPEVAR